MSTSVGGGYCDCGDTEAWKEHPYCATHVLGTQVLLFVDIYASNICINTSVRLRARTHWPRFHLTFSSVQGEVSHLDFKSFVCCSLNSMKYDCAGMSSRVC